MSTGQTASQHEQSTAEMPLESEQSAPRVEACCPYCGLEQHNPNKCQHCGAHTDPLSRQATQNEMGPWFVRDEAHPFRPGCRLETLERWVRSGRIGPQTVIRGPGTNQNWTPAIGVPGIARLLGRCHACTEAVEPSEIICAKCGASLETGRDRQHLGLSPVRALPGRTDPGVVASSLLGGQSAPGARSSHLTRPSPPPVRANATQPDLTPRISRLERRLSQAKRRSMFASILAAAFALLFVFSIVLTRIVDSVALPSDVAVEPNYDPPIKVAGAAMPEAAAGSRVALDGPKIADAGDEAETSGLITELDILLTRGGDEDLVEAQRLLDGPRAESLPADVIERWRGRIELIRRAGERSFVP